MRDRCDKKVAGESGNVSVWSVPSVTRARKLSLHDFGFTTSDSNCTMPANLLAISVKQPWAALLVAGVKTVEIRTWPTRKRGRILIHAAKIADDRPHAWAFVNTPELQALAAYRGGIIGVAELTACVHYDSAAVFAKAAEMHKNDPSWFKTNNAKGLYGFVFQNPMPIAYHACPGQTLFFTVKGITLP